MSKWSKATYLLFTAVVLTTNASSHLQHSLSVTAPSTNILIKNESSCALKLVDISHDNNQTKLSLPSDIPVIEPGALSNEELGNITFSGGFLSSMQQRATGTYQLTCGTQRHLLSLSFFIAPDYYGDGYWVDKTFSRTNAPVILYPPGKTSIMSSKEIVLTLINMESPNEIITEEEIAIAEPEPTCDAVVGDE